jgi:hypothetical protein
VRYRAPPITVHRGAQPAIDPPELHGKYIILDILAEDADGTRYNIEMQVRRQRAWSARSTYYLAKLICDQLVAGDAYDRLCPAVGIHLLDFDLFREPEHQDQATGASRCAMSTPERPARRRASAQRRRAEEGRAPRSAAADPVRLDHPVRALAGGATHVRHHRRARRRAYDKLKTLSADEEARRLAFVRERALHDEAQLRNDALHQTATNLIRDTELSDASIAAATGLDIGEVAALRDGV